MVSPLIDIILDTNVVLRTVVQTDPQHQDVVTAIAALKARGFVMRVLAQSIVEAAGALTRPMSSNGFGRSVAQAEIELVAIEAVFEVLADTPEVYVNWRRLFTTIGASGRQVHDMRIAAAMAAHGVDHILTYNGEDFKRYPDITVISPVDVVV